METDEFVSRVIVSIPARKFTVLSNKGKVLKVNCDTPKQFQDVLAVCKETQDIIELEFEY